MNTNTYDCFENSARHDRMIEGSLSASNNHKRPHGDSTDEVRAREEAEMWKGVGNRHMASEVSFPF